jgi:phage/plasmid-like protein (TIGR03299 family)
MAHRIQIRNGQASLMFVGREPWHGLGQKLDGPATAEEAIRAANLGWNVIKQPVYAGGEDIAYRIRNKFAVVPEDRWGDEDCPIFGIVGADYTPLQNRSAFQFFDPIVGEGAAVYHTVGALGDGKRIWILAKLPGSIRVADQDITDKYLLLSNSHDGESSVQIKFTPVRVVCSNTLTMALSRGPTIRAAHTRDLSERMRNARQALKVIKSHYQEIEDTFKAMAGVKMTPLSLIEYLKAVIPDPKTTEKRRLIRATHQRERAAHLFTTGRGNDLRGVSGTLWAAYNGVAELVDHDGTRRAPEDHLESIWFGDGYLLKARAYEVAKTLAEQ